MPNEINFSTKGNSMSDPRSLRDLPSDVYNYNIAPYGDLMQAIQQRRLNRDAYRLYQQRLPELKLNMEVLECAIRSRDLGLFRDWMQVNVNDFAPSDDWE